MFPHSGMKNGHAGGLFPHARCFFRAISGRADGCLFAPIERFFYNKPAIFFQIVTTCRIFYYICINSKSNKKHINARYL